MTNGESIKAAGVGDQRTAFLTATIAQLDDMIEMAIKIVDDLKTSGTGK